MYYSIIHFKLTSNLIKIQFIIRRKLTIGRRLYSLNEDYFKSWTPNMSYFLGFICADGNIVSPLTMEGNYRLSIGLSSKDKNILETFLTEINSNTKVNTRKVTVKGVLYDICEISIYSKTLVKDLVDMGIVDRKSTIIQYPKVPKEFELDFIRGYFDGNGCVSIDYIRNKNTKNDISQLKVRINSGSQCILSSIQDILHSYGLKPKNVNQFGKFNYEICYSTRESLKLFDLLYKEDSVYLERKYLKFKNGIEKRHDEILKIKKYIKIKGE